MINEILGTIKDTTKDYVGMNGCLYQDLDRKELNIILDYITNIQQENKQLKEEIENLKDFNNKLQASKDRLDKDDYNLAHILTELEEYVKEESNKTIINIGMLQVWNLVLNKIQELKERYK